MSKRVLEDTMGAGRNEDASWEVLQRAFKPAGIKAIAAALGLSYSTIAKWQEDPRSRSESGARNPLDRLDVIRQTLVQAGYGCEAVDGLRWLARRAGYRLVREVSLPEDHEGLLHEILALAAESGDVQRVFHQAIQDQIITPEEERQLLTELREVEEQAVRVGLVLCNRPAALAPRAAGSRQRSRHPRPGSR